jgi:hypothetical protein
MNLLELFEDVKVKRRCEHFAASAPFFARTENFSFVEILDLKVLGSLDFE